MRLSAEKQTALYRAVSDAVMDARIALQRRGVSDGVDRTVRDIETKAWINICQVLKLTSEP